MPYGRRTADLAFTFGLAASRFEARRDALPEEVNAIGTTYLRTAFLPEAYGQNARKLLRQYADNRLEIYSQMLARRVDSQSGTLARRTR